MTSYIKSKSCYIDSKIGFSIEFTRSGTIENYKETDFRIKDDLYLKTSTKNYRITVYDGITPSLNDKKIFIIYIQNVPTPKTYTFIGPLNAYNGMTRFLRTLDEEDKRWIIPDGLIDFLGINLERYTFKVAKVVNGEVAKLEKEMKIARNYCDPIISKMKGDLIGKRVLMELSNKRKEDLITQTRLVIEQVKRINTYSKGIFHIKKFLQKKCRSLETKFVTVMGLNDKDIPTNFADLLGYEDYSTAYLRIFNNYKANPKFIPELIKEDHPIIFLMPNNVLTHPKSGVTKEEMEYFLNHPNSMKNVYFVLGAYDLLTKEDYNYLRSEAVNNYVNSAVDEFVDLAIKRIILNCKSNMALRPEIYTRELSSMYKRAQKLQDEVLKFFNSNSGSN